MSDLIDRQAAIDVIVGILTHGQAMEAERRIKTLPPVDAVPVRRGKWKITDAYPHNVYCSECYTTFAQAHWSVWEDGSLPRNYCPNCGADMREEDKSDGNDN